MTQAKVSQVDEEMPTLTLHPLLLRQMRRAGISLGQPVTSEQLATLLEKVSSSYADAEQDRYLLERSLDVSSQELHYSIELERNRLNTILSTTEDCICSLDANGCVTWANRAALAMLKVDSASSISFCFPNQIQPMPQPSAGASEDLHDCRALLRTFGDRLIPISYIRNSTGGDDGSSVLVFRDITKDQAHEQELLRARESADAANKAKSRLLDNISHEVRTPMHGILGMVQLLSESRLADEEREYLKNLHLSAESLMGLLNNLLEFSRSESGKLILEVAPVDLVSLVEEVRSIVLPDAAVKDLELRCIFTGIPLPRLESDPDRLRHVLLNLTRNSVKFTECGFVEISVHATALSERSVEVEFHVRDSGIGIHKDLQRSIFESFSQADSSMTRRFGGAGLGLTISSQIIHAMGSEISVLSAPGEGSDFTFKLRLKVHRAKTTAEDSLNILYAEDNVINQMTAYKMLSSKGHRVQIVPNGRLAVEAVRTEDFDLVLMDNQMPELSGIEATVTIRALGFTIPIVAVTASTHPDDRETLLAAGMNEFVAKPFTFDQLHSAMSRALEFALDHVAAAPRGPSSV